MKRFFILITPLIVSCATFSHKNIESNNIVETITSLKFETTNSPCLDAMLTNMIIAGCQSIAAEESDVGDTRYRCEVGPQIEFWNSSTFYVTTHEIYDRVGINLESDNVIPFCGDMYVMMFIEE